MEKPQIGIRILDGEYSVCRFDANRQPDVALPAGAFVSVTRTEDELSVVAPAGSLNRFDAEEAGWRVLKLDALLDFALVGVLSDISGVLARAGVSVFALSTYNTDYILVKADKLTRATETLRAAGYTVAEPS